MGTAITLVTISIARLMVGTARMMEQHNSGYVFVVDDDGVYLGVVTRIGIAGLLLAAEP